MDSLEEGHSRFMAEILRLKQILELPPPAFFLLDELLHGTNSHDRAIGAEGLIRALLERGAIGLATTHDLSLARVADELAPAAENVHFEDRLEDGRLVFDYRMRPGVVARSNALDLMRAVGLDVYANRRISVFLKMMSTFPAAFARADLAGQAPPDRRRHRNQHPRQIRSRPHGAGVSAGARPSADRGRARRRQNHPRAIAGPRRRRTASTASSSPATCCRPTCSASPSTTRIPKQFEFKPGPIFTNFLLADEINRTTPKTQSALLEAMNEQQVSVEGRTLPLPDPFMVIATQNPADHHGTYPLPESQLDRFLMRLRIGYPDVPSEREIIRQPEAHHGETTPRVLSLDELRELQERVKQVAVDEAIVDYMLAIVERTRTHEGLALGVSPRGSQALLSRGAGECRGGRPRLRLARRREALAPKVFGHRVVLGVARTLALAAQFERRGQRRAYHRRDPRSDRSSSLNA